MSPENLKDRDGERTARYFAPRRRRPRFRATAGERSETSRAGRFALTARDLDIVEAVARHRFLTSDQIARLFGGGRTKRRLTELFHAGGYLDRPIRQLDLKMRNGELEPGGLPMVYALSEKGAKLLVGEGRLPREAERTKWSRDNAEAGRQFIAHTLGVADVRIAIEVACRARRDVILHHDRDLVLSIPRDFRKHPGAPWSMTPRVLMRETFIDNGQQVVKTTELDVPVLADAVFRLEQTATGKRFHFFVEVDMGTMPIARWKRNGTLNTAGTSILKKVLGYRQAFDSGLHKTLFGWTGFRVLVFTTTEARARHIITEAERAFGKDAAARIRTATLAAAKGDILAHAFFADRDSTETLLPQPEPSAATTEAP